MSPILLCAECSEPVVGQPVTAYTFKAHIAGTHQIVAITPRFCSEKCAQMAKMKREKYPDNILVPEET